MSEYSEVEKPFLAQLAALGWEVIDQGAGAIPTDPARSLRSSFREVALRGVFKNAVSALNKTEDGREWLTQEQLDHLFDELCGESTESLVAANQRIQQKLQKCSVDRNELTGEEYPTVRLIDFARPENNHFLAINQFRVDTPGCVRDFIIPDIVLFVNGLPLIVVECKKADPFKANPLYDAYVQLRRYMGEREETAEAGLKEGEQRLFHFNALTIKSTGERAKFGTITCTEEYYFPWRDIHPEKYADFEPPLGEVREQETLIQGMLNREVLLDLIENCTVFQDTDGRRIKVVARYQQYRAVWKILVRLREGQTPDERSGVVWHTQGSGKSLTMVFVIRSLRSSEDLKDFKVVLVNDRRDLEEQLTGTATLAGEKVHVIESSDALKKELSGPSSDLNMVMLHKFAERSGRHLPDYVREELAQYGGKVPQDFGVFGVVNESSRILIMVDEAHRTQGGDFSDNLFSAFPNATRIAYTGTPLISERHGENRTWKRFGDYIDTYKLQDAVDDEATVQILYEGRTAETAIRDKHGFETKFEDLFGKRTEEELLAIKKKYGTTGDLFEADQRIEEIAQDIVRHYIDNILPNGFKAQVVCNSKLAAVKYQRFLDKALAAALESEKAKPEGERDEELIAQIAFLKTAVVVSKDDTNEKAEITKARKDSLAMGAVDNFKKKFDPDKPETGVAFLIVCDMLLTGFDAPIEQVMYIDKKIKEHNLLQTIARVNRVRKGKSRGYIVDYVGLTSHLSQALSIYSQDDQADIEAHLKGVLSEIPILEQRYNRLLQLFQDTGIAEIQDFVEQKTEPKDDAPLLEKCVDKLEDIKLRANFEVFFKNFLRSLDVVLPRPAANEYRIPAKRLGWILSEAKQRYKDDSINIAGAGEKVKRLVNEHLISLGINPKVPPVELVSPEFIHEVNKATKRPKARASEMEHAIRKHCKVHLEEDPAFYKKMSEKLDQLIQKHKDDWQAQCDGLVIMSREVLEGRKSGPEGLSPLEAPFYELIGQEAFGDGVPAQHGDTVRKLVGDLLSHFHETVGMVGFWEKGPEVLALRGEVSDLLLYTGIDELVDKSEKLVSELVALAKVRTKDLIA